MEVERRSNDLEQLKYCQQGLLPKTSEAPKKLQKKKRGKKVLQFWQVIDAFVFAQPLTQLLVLTLKIVQTFPERR